MSSSSETSTLACPALWRQVLASAFKSPSGPLPSRLKQRELLYGLVKQRTEAYLAQQEQQQQQQQ